jgi:hypothetical protein
MSSNTYGYIADTGPTQAYGSNSGVFDPADINDLIAENKWSGVGTLELIETKTGSSTASLIFTDIKETEYDVHFVTWNNFQSATTNKRLVLRFYESGVEESGSVYRYGTQGCRTDLFGENNSNGVDSIFLGTNTSTSANQSDNGYLYIYNAGDSSKYTYTTQHSTGMYQSGPNYATYFGGAILAQASVVDQLKFFVTSSTNIDHIDISLYGIRSY